MIFPAPMPSSLLAAEYLKNVQYRRTQDNNKYAGEDEKNQGETTILPAPSTPVLVLRETWNI